MKAVIALCAVLIAVPLLAKSPVKPLPGVSNKETTIPYRDIQQSVRGHGDVFFVKDRGNQWYRLQVNEDCARGTSQANGLAFAHHGTSRQIDRFTTALIGGERRTCSIVSIRKSEAPPQVNSKSRVTLE